MLASLLLVLSQQYECNKPDVSLVLKSAVRCIQQSHRMSSNLVRGGQVHAKVGPYLSVFVMSLANTMGTTYNTVPPNYAVVAEQAIPVLISVLE